MITIYTKENCEKCQEIKTIMKEKNIEYIEKSVENVEDLTELIVAGVDISEAPVIEKDGEYFTNKTTGLLKALR